MESRIVRGNEKSGLATITLSNLRGIFATETRIVFWRVVIPVKRNFYDTAGTNRAYSRGIRASCNIFLVLLATVRRKIIAGWPRIEERRFKRDESKTVSLADTVVPRSLALIGTNGWLDNRGNRNTGECISFERLLGRYKYTRQ